MTQHGKSIEQADVALSELGVGESAWLLNVKMDFLEARLAAMGLGPGVLVTVVKNGRGALVVAVERTLLALDRKVCAEIIVEPSIGQDG